MISEELKHESWNEEDWHYIKSLSEAIENVHSKFIFINKDVSQYHLEHIFAYELYYKWKVILKRKGGNPQKLLLNGELTKHYCKTSIYRFPDLVLHKDYKNIGNEGYQCIICEIKSSRNSIKSKDLKKDINSLYGGITELFYKCGVFIYLGDNTNRMISRLRKIKEELEIDSEKRIIFVGVNGYEPHYEIL